METFLKRVVFQKLRDLGVDGDALLLKTPSCCHAFGRMLEVEGGPMLGGKEQKLWRDEKFTDINYESMSILKHPSLTKIQDYETVGTAFVHSFFARSFYQSFRSLDLRHFSVLERDCHIH